MNKEKKTGKESIARAEGSPKVVILFHPLTGHYENYRNFYVPYSIISIATALGKHVKCLLLDNNVLAITNPTALPLPNPESWVMIGISSMIGRQIEDAVRFSNFVRLVAPSCHIVWGGACPTLLPSLALEEGVADSVVVGPGEETIVELWHRLDQGRDIAGLQGVTVLRSGTMVQGGQRPIANYEQLPPYREYYHAINVERYIRCDEHIGTRTVNYHSSQGCVYQCGFCCEPPLWGRQWVGMRAKRIIDDLLPLIGDFGINGIKFYDSEFFINRHRAIEFAQLLIKEGFGIRWAASIHPLNLVAYSDTEMRLLRTSGLSRLLIGAETPIESELRLIGKKIPQGVVERCAKICEQLDISASFTFVTGYPGSPPSAIDRTLEFARTLLKSSNKHEAKVHFYGPYPGTPMYQLAIKYGFCPPKTLASWADFDYYCVQTPWVPEYYYERVRAFNDKNYPYLIGEDPVGEITVASEVLK